MRKADSFDLGWDTLPKFLPSEAVAVAACAHTSDGLVRGPDALATVANATVKHSEVAAGVQVEAPPSDGTTGSESEDESDVYDTAFGTSRRPPRPTR